MITGSKKDYNKIPTPFYFSFFLINFYKYLREPFYHIKREGKTSFFGFISHWKSCFGQFANGKKIYIDSSLHPKSDIHYLKKVLLKERLHPWHLLSYYGHFTSFCCLSRWQRCFIFIPSLRSEPTGVNKAAQWVEGVFITSVAFLRVTANKTVQRWRRRLRTRFGYLFLWPKVETAD